MGRTLGLAVAGLMVLVGGVWWGQGMGWIGGSSMTGQEKWSVIGAITAGLGIALFIVVVGNARRARGGTDLEKDRYGQR